MISNTSEIHMNFARTLIKWIYLSWLHRRPGNSIGEKLFEKHGPRKRVMERMVSNFFGQIFIIGNCLDKNFGTHERLWNICSLLGMMVSQIIIGSWIKNSKNMEILLKKISKKIIIIWHWRRLGNSNGRHITVQIWNTDFILMMMYLVRQRVIHT